MVLRRSHFQTTDCNGPEEAVFPELAQRRRDAEGVL
jgi:hypothetical protein